LIELNQEVPNGAKTDAAKITKTPQQRGIVFVKDTIGKGEMASSAFATRFSASTRFTSNTNFLLNRAIAHSERRKSRIALKSPGMVRKPGLATF